MLRNALPIVRFGTLICSKKEMKLPILNIPKGNLRLRKYNSLPDYLYY